MRVLVVNAGSSSLKVRVLDGDSVVATADLGADAVGDASAVVDAVGDDVTAIDAVGHRIVHGGEAFRDPVVVDGEVARRLREVASLAPLHDPPALAVLDGLRKALPQPPHVACFDTAFHATLPAAASTYAVPAAWRDRGVRKYGFHGLSHAYVARRAPEVAGRSAAGMRLVSCHLGSGSSLAAVVDGRSVDTTMGFTPVAGVVMATRPGDFDPGAMVWLAQQGLSVEELSEGLEHEGGLRGLAGDADLQAVLRRADEGDGEAQLAVDVYAHRLRAEIAAMVAAMGGIDLLAFTGGVGEHSAAVRAAAGGGLAFLGVAIDEDRNAGTTSDGRISPDDAEVAVVVVSAREDLEIVRGVRRALRR